MDIVGENLVEYAWSPLVMIILSLFFILVYPKPRGPMTSHSKFVYLILIEHFRKSLLKTKFNKQSKTNPQANIEEVKIKLQTICNNLRTSLYLVLPKPQISIDMTFVSIHLLYLGFIFIFFFFLQNGHNYYSCYGCWRGNWLFVELPVKYSTEIIIRILLCYSTRLENNW